MKKLLFTFFLICILSSTAYAFEDTVENYPSAITDTWTITKTGSGNNPVVAEYPGGSGFHSIYFSCPSTTSAGGSSATTKTYIDSSYFSFVVKSFSATGSDSGAGYYTKIIIVYTNTTAAYSLQLPVYVVNPVGTVTFTNSTFEILRSNGRYLLYRDGVYQADMGAAAAYPNVGIQIYTVSQGGVAKPASHSIYIDDISNSGSTIGIKEEINELSSNFLYTQRIQAYSSYPTSVYTANLYSLTASNAGLISTQTLTSQSGDNGFSRSLVGSNYGLYMIELKRDNDILKDSYFYYYQSANPQYLPDNLFRGESSVNTEIRDEDNNGGGR